MRAALHFFIAVFPCSTGLHTGWPMAERRAKLNCRASTQPRLHAGRSPSPWWELEKGIRNSFKGMPWEIKTDKNPSTRGLAREPNTGLVAPQNIVSLSKALSSNSSSAATPTAVAAALPELAEAAAEPVVPLGQRLLNAMMPRRQEGMPEEYIRMVRLLLRTSERAEQWQREVDDYRNDEDYEAADLLAAAESLFSARDVPRAVAPLVLLLPEKYLSDTLRDELFKQQRDRPTLVTTGKLLMPGSSPSSSTGIVRSSNSSSMSTSSSNLNRGWRGFLRNKRESMSSSSSTSSSESASDGAPSYVWSMLSATAQVFPAATAVFTLFALSIRDSVTGKWGSSQLPLPQQPKSLSSSSSSSSASSFTSPLSRALPWQPPPSFAWPKGVPASFGRGASRDMTWQPSITSAGEAAASSSSQLVRPVELARQWAAQQRRNAAIAIQQEGQLSAATVNPKQKYTSLAISALPEVPEEVLDFAASLEAFFVPPFLKPLPPPPPPPTPVELLFDNLQGGLMRNKKNNNRFNERRVGTSTGGSEWWQRFKLMGGGISSIGAAKRQKNSAATTPVLLPPLSSQSPRKASAPPVFGPTRRPKRPKAGGASATAPPGEPSWNTMSSSVSSRSSTGKTRNSAASSPRRSSATSGPRVATPMPKGGTEIVLDDDDDESGGSDDSDNAVSAGWWASMKRVAFGNEAKSRRTNNNTGTNKKQTSATAATDARILREHHRGAGAARDQRSQPNGKRRAVDADNILLASKDRRRHQRNGSSKRKAKNEREDEQPGSKNGSPNGATSEGFLSQLWSSWLRPRTRTSNDEEG